MDMLSFQLTNPRSVPLVTLVANCNFGTISVAEKNFVWGGGKSMATRETLPTATVQTRLKLTSDLPLCLSASV